MKTTTKDFVTLRTRKRASGLEALYLDISYDGQRRTEYLKLYLTGGRSREDKAKDKETMRQAEMMRAQRVLDLQNRRMGITRNNPEDVLFYPYYDRVMATKTGNTKILWECVKKKLLLYHPDKRLNFSEVTPRWLRGFCIFLDTCPAMHSHPGCVTQSKRKLNGKTKFMYFTKVKAVLECAVVDEIIPRNPAKGLGDFKSDSKQREYLTVEEVRRLNSTPSDSPMLKRMFLFSCLTGLRFSDITKLRWSEVHSENGLTWLSFRQQKTKGVLTIHIDPQAKRLIGEEPDGDSAVFPYSKQPSQIAYTLNKWVRAAGIKKHITFHCARHTFATAMLNQGVDIFTVSKLLGHASVKTTLIYAKLMDKTKIEAMQKVPQIL